jgi:hypothetical protein
MLESYMVVLVRNGIASAGHWDSQCGLDLDDSNDSF